MHTKKWKFRRTGRPCQNDSHFGSWLKNSLHDREITIKEFAIKTGVDKANLYNYVRGRSLPSITNYVYIIQGLSRITKQKKENLYLKSLSLIEKDI